MQYHKPVKPTLFSIYPMTEEGTDTVERLFKQDNVRTTHNNLPIDKAKFFSTLETADYILLGEIHDNKIHHLIEAFTVHHLITTDWLQQLSLEMLTPSQLTHFKAQQGLPGNDASAVAALKQQLLWKNESWQWLDYQSIIVAAHANNIPLEAANLDPMDIMSIYKGASAVDIPHPTPFQTDILAESIIESHCGFIKADQAGPMVNIQLARDLTMANSLTKTSKGSLLVSGSFHARKDVGVPTHLDKISKEKNILVIGMVEQTEEGIDMAKLASRYDIVMITPAAKREDPCKAFNK